MKSGEPKFQASSTSQSIPSPRSRRSFRLRETEILGVQLHGLNPRMVGTIPGRVYSLTTTLPTKSLVPPAPTREGRLRSAWTVRRVLTFKSKTTIWWSAY